MKNKLKFIIAITIVIVIASCGWFKKTVEEKVNEKIDENLRKIDSSLSKERMDSLMKSLDSIKVKSDSIINKNKGKSEKRSTK